LVSYGATRFSTVAVIGVLSTAGRSTIPNPTSIFGEPSSSASLLPVDARENEDA
jgi:hypothetical protein